MKPRIATLLAASAALMAVAAAPVGPDPITPVEPYRRRVPLEKTNSLVDKKRREIKAWNDAVEARKKAKKGGA